MRIDEVELLDGAFDSDQLIRVEMRRKAMMRVCRGQY